MIKTLRANCFLLLSTFAICAIAFPAAMYGIGKVIASTGTSGSLVEGSGAVRGSRLIGQPFSGDEYFWPRPSAAGNGYDALTASGSNLSANNPKLRDRVAQQLGPMVVYKKGSRSAAGDRTPQQDIEAWIAADPDRTAKRSEIAVSGANIHANFFDLWVSDPANAEKTTDLEPVAADMVMASGSGLDPHITVRNAMSVYQLDRIAAKRSPTPTDAEHVKQGIVELIRSKSHTPLSGLVGEPLVNVLELNLELDAKFPRLAKAP